MIKLPNDCRCSGTAGNPDKGIQDELPVFPKNWKQVKASLKKNWYIHYRFYDPINAPTGKFIIVKAGINEFKTVAERRAAIKEVMSAILFNLKVMGYNPATGALNKPSDFEGTVEYEIDPDTPFIQALKAAFARVSYVKNTMDNIRHILNYFEKSAIKLGIENIPIKDIRKRHIRMVIENVARIKDYWSSNQFNHYRAHISLLFRELEQVDAIESNPVISIRKEKCTKKLRRTLTRQEREKINNHLKSNYYEFYRYMHIFFHSGGRTTELLQVKRKDVDLIKQEYQVTVKKGEQNIEVIRPIKTVALPFWIELLDNCKNDDYIFSNNLTPGAVSINPKQISKRWRLHVKIPLGITVNFYTLKHMNVTEVMDELTNVYQKAAEEATKLTSHKSTKMIETVYDLKYKQRKDEAIKAIDNGFV